MQILLGGIMQILLGGNYANPIGGEIMQILLGGTILTLKMNY